MTQPNVLPVTTPEDEPMDAIAGSLLVHIPPDTPSVSVVVNPRPTALMPEMAVGSGVTVTMVVTKQPAPNE